jgi:hypothetical protein
VLECLGNSLSSERVRTAPDHGHYPLPDQHLLDSILLAALAARWAGGRAGGRGQEPASGGTQSLAWLPGSMDRLKDSVGGPDGQAGVAHAAYYNRRVYGTPLGDGGIGHFTTARAAEPHTPMPAIIVPH